MRRLVPRALQLREEVRTGGIDEERVGREERGDREPLSRRRLLANLAVDREHDREIDGSRRPLRRELEVAQIDDLVAPELHAHGIGHPERVHVEDAAAETELRDILDHRHALEPDALEVRRQLAWATYVTLAKLDAEILQGAR